MHAMEDAVGPALDVDSKPAFLFESEAGELLGVSLRADGADLPPGRRGEPWRFRCTFLLGVHEPVPETVDPEPILRGVAARGYFVWRRRRTEPFGTSQ